MTAEGDPGSADIVYVLLLDEGSDAWRPVPAKHLRDDVYLLVGPQADEDEVWQFPAGSEVRVEVRQLSLGTRQVAVSRAEDAL
jgi:hypothetical protein